MWRFSRWDGRFVFDYADGKRVGFFSDRWADVDDFAAYVTKLEGMYLAARSSGVK